MRRFALVLTVGVMMAALLAMVGAVPASTQEFFIDEELEEELDDLCVGAADYVVEDGELRVKCLGVGDESTGLTDTNGDGIIDSEDWFDDSDGDGIADFDEWFTDTDEDGIDDSEEE